MVKQKKKHIFLITHNEIIYADKTLSCCSKFFYQLLKVRWAKCRTGVNVNLNLTSRKIQSSDSEP